MKVVFNFSELQLSGLILKKEKKKKKREEKTKFLPFSKVRKQIEIEVPQPPPPRIMCSRKTTKKKFLTNSSGICMFCVFFNIRYVLKSVATVHLLGEAHK